MHAWIVAAVSFVHGRARERTRVRFVGGLEGWWRLPAKKRRAGAAFPLMLSYERAPPGNVRLEKRRELLCEMGREKP